MDNKKIVIIGGGTVSHVRNHLALCAPAYGNTARMLDIIAMLNLPKLQRVLTFTRMAGGRPGLETNEDVSRYIDTLLDDDTVKVIIMSAALCDFNGQIGDTPSGKYANRLSTKNWEYLLATNETPTQESRQVQIALTPAEKIIGKIRQKRKDIFLVGFKTTCGKTEDEQYIAGLDLCKKASCNLVLANDTKTRLNMIVTPEEARYHVTTERNAALVGLIDMIRLRSNLTFTRSTVIAGEPIPWDSELVPSSLRAVVDYCIEKNAYKPFNGSTAGHFAVKVNDNTFLTSIRKTDFNKLKEIGLVRIQTDGPDTVIAYGAKPSVGGQSQRIVFRNHQDMDCIVHFHCPIKPSSTVPTVSQREFECGSHQCGNNTSKGLKQFGNLKAVYLDQHGPNIVFNRNINPQEVIQFIEENFDLSQKTGGFVSVKSRLETPNTLEVAQQIL